MHTLWIGLLRIAYERREALHEEIFPEERRKGLGSGLGGSLKLNLRCNNSQPEVGCKSRKKTNPKRRDETAWPVKAGRILQKSIAL